MFGGLHFLPATNTDAKAKSFKIVFKCCWNFRLRAGSARQGGPRVTSKASARPKVEVKTKIGVKERGWTLDVLNVVAAVCDRRKFSGAHRAPLQSWKEFTTADADAFTRELEKLLRQPACAGQDSPTIAGVARHGFVIAPWSWRMEIALAPSGVESL